MARPGTPLARFDHSGSPTTFVLSWVREFAFQSEVALLPVRLFTLVTALLLCLSSPARAQSVTLSLTCDLGGAPAQMLLEVHYQQAFDYSTNYRGNISGLFPIGVSIYTAGQVVSGQAGYSFIGQNEFAEFPTIGSMEQFRVKWVLDPQRNGLWMIVNPFGDPRQHFCQFHRAM